jgi:uncharacterized protein
MEDKGPITLPRAGKQGKMRIIALEEHFATMPFLEGPGHETKKQAEIKDNPQAAERAAKLIGILCDIGDGRIAEMDAAGIDMQVLSLLTPGVEQLDSSEAVKLARNINDHLAEAIQRHPDRFAGLAALPIQAPEIAAQELERMVHEHGFKGASINGHSRGRYLDETFFWPILERAEALQVPLYIHPTPPPQAVIDAYYTGNFPLEVTALLKKAGWGWHIETATHVLRLILSGAFDHYPNLQIMIGHLGEGIPFMMSRTDSMLSPQITKLKHPVSTYIRQNIYYTFGGFNFIHPFFDLLLQVGAERIMFSTDYPYGSLKTARDFLLQLPVSPADKERIAHGNAERLLKI